MYGPRDPGVSLRQRLSIMDQKLDNLVQRSEELDELLARTEIASDPEQVSKLAKTSKTDCPLYNLRTRGSRPRKASLLRARR